MNAIEITGTQPLPYYCREVCPARMGGDLTKCGHLIWLGKTIEQCQADHAHHSAKYEKHIQLAQQSAPISADGLRDFGMGERRW
jgi:hypothetical protein